MSRVGHDFRPDLAFDPDPALSRRGGSQMYGNFDIILVHLTRVCQPSTTPLALCAMFYLVSILTGC